MLCKESGTPRFVSSQYVALQVRVFSALLYDNYLKKTTYSDIETCRSLKTQTSMKTSMVQTVYD